MNIRKSIRATVLLFFVACGAVLYSSCQKDSCELLNCKNGGSCYNGYCNCPTGYEGSECDVRTADRFVGRYIGYLQREGFPPLVDTVDITLVAAPDTVSVFRRGPMEGGAYLYGRTVGDKILIPDQHVGNELRRTLVILEHNKITLTDLAANDTDSSWRTVDAFYGFK